MNAKTMNLGFLAIALALSGCHSTEPTRSVEWFVEHRQELKNTLAECNGNPGELAATTNCINAKKAQGKITWCAKGGGVKVEPLQFGKKE